MLWFACYDDPPVVDPPAVDPPIDDPIKTQEQLNSVLKREKEKFRKDREKLAKQLEDHKNSARLTQEQKEALEAQIEELRNQTMTAEERARHQLTKTQKEAEEKLLHATGSAKNWENRYQDLRIGYEISSAAVLCDVLPNSVQFVEALLRPRTRLVQEIDAEGKPIDHFTAKVKFDDTDKDGKPITLDLQIGEAVKRMKELPEKYGNLFKGTASSGLGGNTGTPGKKPNVAKMTTEEYMEARKKDPASIGLK
jgi:flagellar biosynthesis GTPase FlhF